MSDPDRIIDHLKYLGQLASKGALDRLLREDVIDASTLDEKTAMQFEEMRQRGVAVISGDAYMMDGALRSHLERAVGQNSFYVSFAGVDGAFSEISHLMRSYQEAARDGKADPNRCDLLARQFRGSITMMTANIDQWLRSTRIKAQSEFGETTDTNLRLSQAEFYLTEAEKASRTIHVCGSPTQISLDPDGPAAELVSLYDHIVRSRIPVWLSEIDKIIRELREYAHRVRKQEKDIRRLRRYLEGRATGQITAVPDIEIDQNAGNWMRIPKTPPRIRNRVDLTSQDEATIDMIRTALRKAQAKSGSTRKSQEYRDPPVYVEDEAVSDVAVREESDTEKAWSAFLSESLESGEPRSLRAFSANSPHERLLLNLGLVKAVLGNQIAGLDLRIESLPPEDFSSHSIVTDIIACPLVS